MGFPCEVNYILRLLESQGLDEHTLHEGESFEFSKQGHRIYPVDAPIDLANEDWQIIARVVVSRFCVGGGKTTGTVKVLCIYDPSTRDAITKAVREGERRNGRLA
jgi:hypothetical protein